MLDKSVPYKEVLMARSASAPMPESKALPEGYTARLFRPGDEAGWASVETSVGEFDNTEEGLRYFHREFTPHLAEVQRRLTLICDPSGCPVATATAWWSAVQQNRFGMIHWVAVTPHCQGMGLGRAVTIQAMNRLAELEPGQVQLLHTQTWSHIAIRMYQTLGFRLVTGVSPVCPKNDVQSALSVLQTVLEPESFQALTARTVDASRLINHTSFGGW